MNVWIHVNSSNGFMGFIAVKGLKCENDVYRALDSLKNIKFWVV